MKKAVIVIGTHGAGKSKTIREYVKPMLGLTKNQKKFTLNQKTGYILSQSFEEGNKDVEEMINKYSHYSYLILAGRPLNETLSYTKDVEQKLKLKKYTVELFEIEKDSDKSYYEQKAKEILSFLNK